MRLVSFAKTTGQGFGVIKNDGIVDLTGRTRYSSLRALIAAGGLEEAAKIAAASEPDVALEGTHLLPPIPDPGKIICVGLNYHAHVAETGRKLTEKPALFNRFAESQIGHLQPMIKPRESDQLDYEGELAIVIGKAGRRISEQDALGYVAGYACYNDGSVRDWQYHTTQFLPGKNFNGTGAFGPWLVSSDEIPDPSALRLTTRLNGNVMQTATVDMMITSIAAQIAYISTFTTLEPGDVIVTGTPGGVGSKRTPPLFMKAGDVIEVEIDRIGILRNTVANER
ncbi:MAG TPA: fumarylacetoacetate hydrolase family protein [Xanthobacteraceae bacterium]|jgi:2-keto-4-pentenoate hydratase/2-oxohepta-3-ene-1,7-dioic acid hydratase in catechol pathway|nr:fumarylacetoacetate hydrolase family protein [Xanthobacteraceae bacterium]